MHATRRTVLASLALGVAAPALIGRARAAVPVVVASLLGEDKPETLIWHRIREAVERELPGEFVFNIVPNAALGGERQVVEGIRLGSIQASLSTLSSLSAWVPETQLFDLPFLFRDAAHLDAALQDDCEWSLHDRLAQEGIVAPAFISYGARHLLAREKLAAPQDIRGKRIRIIESPLHAQLWEGLGALPIALPITETYNALSTGHVDAMDLTKSAYAGFRLYEVVPHVIETGHIRAAGAVVFSRHFWSGLTPGQQDVFSAAASEGARYFNMLMEADEHASVMRASAAGAVFHAAENRAGWEEGARGVWDAFADRVGGMERILSIAALAPGGCGGQTR